MELVFEQKVYHGALEIAISPDKSRVAISSERKITILDTVHFQRIVTIPISHATSMIFLSDSAKMLILNTTGILYFWDGDTVEKLGKWAVPRWAETPLFYSGGSYAFWTLDGVVWRYNINLRTMDKIYSSSKDLVICKCSDGQVRLIGYRRGIPRQALDLTTIDYDGNVISSVQTDRSVYTHCMGIPCWTNSNTVVFSALAKSQGIFHASLTSYLYLINTVNGEVKLQRYGHNYEDSGDCYHGTGMVAEVYPVLSKDVVLYTADKLEYQFRIGKDFFDASDKINPPTQAHFLDSRVLVGSWKYFYVFRIQS